MSFRLLPLRERPGDILPLARRAIQTCARGGQAALSLSVDAERKILEHGWPGNARELANIVQRAAWLAAGGIIHAADLDTGAAPGAADPGLTPGNEMAPGDGAAARGVPAAGAAPALGGTRAVGGMPAAGGAMAAGVASGTAMAVDLKERERELILATLRQTGGSRKLTAERLGISPRTLRHKLQALKAAGVSVPRLHEQQFAAV
mgnify:FL=1